MIHNTNPHRFVTIAILVMAIVMMAHEAAHAFTVDNIEFRKISNSTVTVVKGTYSGDMVIPETIEYEGTTYTVTEISDYAFDSMGGLTSISLPNSIERIGTGAFNSCVLLSSIEIPDKVTSIEMETFYNCSGLKTVRFPVSLQSIGDYSFYDCKRLNDLEFPSTLKSIGDYAFTNCEYLTEIELPDGCDQIGTYVFAYCSSLSEAKLPASIPDVGNNLFMGCTSLSEIVIPEKVTVIYPNAFYGCTRLSSVDIQGPVTSIHTGVFDGCTYLESITLPETLESIGDAAFRRSNLMEITIPGNVKSIGYACFDRCPQLENVIFADGEESLELGEMAMGRLKATSLYLGRDLTYTSDEYGSTPFYNCTGLVDITIGNNVTDATALFGSRYTKLAKLSSNAIDPPVMRPFSEDLYKSVEVTVHQESIEKYHTAEVWKEFVKMNATVGMDCIEVVDDSSIIVYDINGHEIKPEQMKDGAVYLVKQGASVKKVIGSK